MTGEQEFDSIELMETTQASFDYIKRENRMGEPRKDAPSETDKDRCQSCKACEICNVSDGRGGCAEGFVL